MNNKVAKAIKKVIDEEENQLTIEEYIAVCRKDLYYLEGLADGLGNNQSTAAARIKTRIDSMRKNLRGLDNAYKDDPPDEQV